MEAKLPASRTFCPSVGVGNGWREGVRPGQAHSRHGQVFPSRSENARWKLFWGGRRGAWWWLGGVFGTSCLEILELLLSPCLGLLRRGLGTGQSLSHWCSLSPTLPLAGGRCSCAHPRPQMPHPQAASDRPPRVTSKLTPAPHPPSPTPRCRPRVGR